MHNLVGIFGGTFDPIHFGHLRPALDIMQQVGLQQVRFLPNARPPHRAQPWLDAATRKHLVQMAIADQPGFVLDDRELRREGPSYMADTLADLQAELPDATLCLLLGCDAFAGFTQWHKWQAILGLCHIIVMTRPGVELAALPAQPSMITSRICQDVAALANSSHGLILLQSVTALDISSSRIRENLRQGLSIRYLLPESIRQHLEGLYAI
jgi:nicotinate-nucleotide adenylyltransferase